MQLIIENLECLRTAAKDFIQNMGEAHVFAFYGNMGVGKTTFIKAICEELGVEDVVNSPTFAIVNEYRDRNDRPIYHFDFYRIKNEREAYDIGFDDYLYSNGLCLIEWPELIEDLLPEDAVKVSMVEEAGGRRIIEF